MTLLAVTLGIIAIACWFYACVMHDRYNQLRALTDRHLYEAITLIEHCDALERHDAYLESERCQYRALLAVSMLHLPTPLGETDKMTISNRDTP